MKLFVLIIIFASAGFADTKPEALATACWEQLSDWVTKEPFKDWTSPMDLNPVRQMVVNDEITDFWFDNSHQKLFIFTENAHHIVDVAKNKARVKKESPAAGDLDEASHEITPAARKKYETVRSKLKVSILNFCYGETKLTALQLVRGLPTYSSALKEIQIESQLWKVNDSAAPDCSADKNALVVKDQDLKDFNTSVVKHLALLLAEKARRVSEAGLAGVPSEDDELGQVLKSDEWSLPKVFSKASEILTACDPLLNFSQNKFLSNREVSRIKDDLEYISQGWRPKLVEQKNKPASSKH